MATEEQVRVALANICSILINCGMELTDDEHEALDDALALIPEQFPCADAEDDEA